MKIMGTKFWGHDSTAVLLDFKNEDIFAITTERVTRIKHDNYSIQPILEEYKDMFNNIDVVTTCFANFNNEDCGYETKGTSYFWLKMQRILRKELKPKYLKDLSNADESKIKNKEYWSLKAQHIKYMKKINTLGYDFHKNYSMKYIKEILNEYNIETNKIYFINHHLSHAFASYYFSDFFKNDEKALVFTIDGHGDGLHSSLYEFSPNNYKLISESKITKFQINDECHITSIGEMYSNFTEAMDLIRASDEGKVEALAAYGKKNNDIYNDLLNMVNINNNLEFQFDLKVFKKYSNISYLKKIIKEIGDANFCATIQCWLEDVIVNYLNKVYEKFPVNNLCLGGGVSANIIMSLNIYERTPFKNIFVLPPMGDEGAALGSAIYQAFKLNLDLNWLKKYVMPYLGAEIDYNQNIEQEIKKFKNIEYTFIGKEWYKEAADSIANNKIIAVANGKMEFGPRALGNRSILANVMHKDTQDRINLTVKRRPKYQPFCPTILEEERERLFEKSYKHKHMATAFRMKREFWDILPSAIHIDGTARPQFVEKDDNEDIYNLLKELKRLTGYGIMINTSFNLHGRTIVRTISDAITDFIDCNIDELFIEGYKIVRK